MKSKKIILLLSSIISIFSLIFLYKAPLGVNFSIFTLLLSLILVIYAGLSKKLNFSAEISLLFFILSGIPFCLTTSYAIRIPLLILWFYLLISFFYSIAQKQNFFEFYRYITSIFELSVMAFIGPFLGLSEIKFLNKKKVLSRVFRVIAGILISLPILLIFTLLFYSADLKFQEIVGNLFSINFFNDFIKIFIWFLGVAWLGFGTIFYIFCKKNNYNPTKEIIDFSKPRLFIESTTVLILLETLFAIFNIIQIRYLFGGESNISSSEFTYSEYARKGFFELIFASILALGIIMIIMRMKKSASGLKDKIIRLIAVIGVLELIPMAISSFYRLYLYEQAYGYTRLRVYSHLFVIFLLLIMLLFIIKYSLNLKNRLFYYFSFLITVFSLVLAGFLNVDEFITKANYQKYLDEDEGNFDVQYVSSLSYDNIPYLVEIYQKIEDEEIKNDLEFYLSGKYQEIEYFDFKDDFRGFNFSFNNARNSLLEIKDNFKKDEDYLEVVENSELQYRRVYCAENCIYYYSKTGSEIYFDRIVYYNLEDGKKYEYSSNSINVPEGKYFIEIPRLYSFESNKEYFLIEVEKDKDLTIVSRKFNY